MIIDTSCYPTNLVDLAWRHDGAPFTGERLLKMMDGPYTVRGKPRRIDKAFIQPPQGNTIYTDGRSPTSPAAPAIEAYMAYTVELVRKIPGSLHRLLRLQPALRIAERRRGDRAARRRSTASRWSSCRPTCTPTGPTARSTGCARR